MSLCLESEAYKSIYHSSLLHNLVIYYACSTNNMSSYNFDVTSSGGSEEETFELIVSDLRPYDFEPVPSHPVSQPDSNDCVQANEKGKHRLV